MDTARLGDLMDIFQLKSRYFRYMDTKDWANWRNIFTDDLVFFQEDSVLPASNEPILVGGDNFVEYVSARLATSVTAHHGHMPDITFTGEDDADGIWAMYDWVDDPERDIALQGFGHYYESYRRCDDCQWRVCRLRLTRIRVDHIAPTRPSGARPWPPPWTAGR